MDTQRIQTKVQVLGLLPEPVLNGIVAEAALRRSIDLLSVSISSNTPSDDDERRRILSVVRDVLRTVPLPPTTEGLGDGTANELLQTVQNLINATPTWEVREEAALLLIDLQRTGLQMDRNAVVNRLNEFFGSAPIDAVPMLVSYLGGPSLSEFPESAEQLRARCVNQAKTFKVILGEAPENQKPDWIRSMLPRSPLPVLRALDEVELQDDDWTSIAKLAIDHAAGMSPAQQVEILAEVSSFRDETLLPTFNSYAEGLLRLLTCGDDSIASQALKMLRDNPSHIEEPGRARLLASRLQQWFLSAGDTHHPSVVEALLLVWAQLSPEEQDAVIGRLFDRGIRDESRPPVAEHALQVLGALGVRYDAKRGPNFEDIRSKFQNSGDPAMKDAILRGLERIKHGGTKGSKAFWEWWKTVRQA